jgi:hypothetical protein
MGGQKVKKLAEIFVVDAEIPYVLVVNISIFMIDDLFYFFQNLLDLSFINKINLTKSSF